MILGQTGDPAVEPSDVAAIKRGQRLRELWVGSNLAERRWNGRPSLIVAFERAVIGQADVAAALDVERGEVESAGARRAEEEVAKIVDDKIIDFFGGLGRGS